MSPALGFYYLIRAYPQLIYRNVDLTKLKYHGFKQIVYNWAVEKKDDPLYNICVYKYYVLTVQNYVIESTRYLMGVSYKKLWIKIAEKEMKKTDFIETADISSNTLAKLGKNEYISMEVVERICRAFQCDIGDIMEINYDDKSEENKC